MIKRVILGVILVGSVSAYSMTCSYVDGKFRPSDAESKKLANDLKVSTCDGKNFQLAVEALGKKISETSVSDTQAQKIRDDLDKVKKDKLLKKLKRKGYKVSAKTK